MEKLKTLVLGKSGVLAAGLAVGSVITRIVDSTPAGAVIGLGLIMYVGGIVVGGLIFKGK